MKVIFWGTQGSLPAPLTAAHIRDKIFHAVKAASGLNLRDDAAIETFIDEQLPFAVRGSYGTNTSCLEVSDGSDEEVILCDAGSGIRDYAHRLVQEGKIRLPRTYHIFMTHLHWDHIQGFPFFVPIYVPGNRIIIHTYHEETEAALRRQMQPPTFPVRFEQLGAEIEFDLREPLTPYEVAGFQITSIEQNHPGISYGYRFEKDGKVLVHSTDAEHNQEAYAPDYRFVKFFEEADLLIFDAQYDLAQSTYMKANWGHSSNVMAIELAARSRVKRLAIFHHEPTNTDWQLDDFLRNTHIYRSIYFQESGEKIGHRRWPEEVLLAFDGLVIDL